MESWMVSGYLYSDGEETHCSRESDNAHRQRNRQRRSHRLGIIEQQPRLDPQREHITQIHVHRRPQLPRLIRHRPNPAITENRKFLSERDLRDLYRIQHLGLQRSVQDFIQTPQERIIRARLLPELCDRLRNQDIKPVQTLRLVRVDIIIRLCEDARCRQWRGIP